MSSLNKVMLIGRLGKDPETQHFDGGAIKASFSLATTERYKTRDGQLREQTEWHNVVVWNKLAEIAGRYLRKGKLIYLEGRIRTRSWEDKSGNKRYTTEIDARNFTMLGSKSEESGRQQNSSPQRTTNNYNNNQQASYNAPPPPTQQVATPVAPVNQVDNSAQDLDDLPF